MHFLADEMHRLRIRHENHAHAIGGLHLFIARRAAAAVIATALSAERPALAIALAETALACIITAVIASRRTIA